MAIFEVLSLRGHDQGPDLRGQGQGLQNASSRLRTSLRTPPLSQRWSRGHKARGQGQGHKKNPRPRTAFPRTDTLEAKDRNARGQGPRTQAQVLSKKKRSSQKFFRRSPQQNVFQKIFQVLHKILTIQKIVLSSSRGQANFRGLEASRPMSRT